jgi:hypothetical protein
MVPNGQRRIPGGEEEAEDMLGLELLLVYITGHF